MILFKDISYAQGAYNMDANNDPMIMMKMSGGDGVSQRLYFDIQASRNYNNAIRTGKLPFMYHFYGGGDPIAEADWFLRAVSPLAPGDGLAIDVERGTWWNPQTDPNAVAKVKAFVTHIHDVTGVWPWVYMNMSTANMYDWSSVLDKCGYWCAAPSFSFDDTLPVKYPQIAQQGPIVNSVDTNAFFGTLDQLKKYTYQAPVAPVPEPPVPPVVTPPVPTPEPTPIPEPPVVIPPTPTPPNPDTPAQAGLNN
jgi:hypothetical protein